MTAGDRFSSRSHGLPVASWASLPARPAVRVHKGIECVHAHGAKASLGFCTEASQPKRALFVMSLGWRQSGDKPKRPAVWLGFVQIILMTQGGRPHARP